MGKQKWCVLAIALSSAVAAAAPPKGAYKIVKWVDDRGTRTPADSMKKAEMEGEILIMFDGDTVRAGTWAVAKDSDDKKPEVHYVTACRGQASGPVKWAGDSFKLDAPIEFEGFADNYTFTTIKSGKDKGKLAIHSHQISCGYMLEASSYKVSGAGDKITLTATSGKQFFLERATPIADIDTRAAAEKISDE